MKDKTRIVWIVMVVFVVLGLLFSAISAYDFIAHLDRQVHAITCSFTPGLAAADSSGTSGCHAVLMSPYSALFRTSTWGGIPNALASLAVFAYLLFRLIDIFLRKLQADADETRFLLVASLLPLAMTVIYFAISVFIIGAVCKVCIGIYLASIGTSVAAFLAHRGAVKPAGKPVMPWGRYALYFVEGVVFVAVPVVLYLALKPAYGQTTVCGELLHSEDKYNIRLKLTSPVNGVSAIEVLDPLCPACKAMGQRLAASGFNDRLAIEAVLFPLDKACNWMVQESVHPGACTVSEAVLCAGVQTNEVLDWIFRHQDELRDLGKTNPDRIAGRITEAFPQLSGCIGKSEVRSRLNRSLRWAVTNSLPVLTPQLYVRGEKVCDEDTDLGLDYVINRILEERQGSSRPAASNQKKGGR